MGENNQFPNKDALRSALKRRGLKMQQLAGLIGISRCTLSMKVNGRFQFTVKEANEIKNLLGLSAAEFMEIFCG